MDKKTYSNQEAVQTATKYFNGDSLAGSVWVSKYALKSPDGEILESSPIDMHLRMAQEVARIENKYPNPMTQETIFELFDKFKYIIPQGGSMTGIGNNNQISSISNCFVIGTDTNSDSYGGVLKIDEEQIQLMKRRGGVGHDLSHIRPAGSPVLNSALTSTGIVPFMERYSNSTREVAQDGRRGALMLSLSVKHPDAEKFIDAKMDSGKVTGANVSVKLDDEFMRAVVENKGYRQQFPIDSDSPRVISEIDARTLWNKIIHNAWKSAEPGVLFWDTITRESVADCYADQGFKTVSTNPCQPEWATVLTPNGISTIGEINIGDKIWSSEGWTVVVNKQCTGIKDVHEYRTSAGSFIGTENHRIISNGEKIEVKDADSIDILTGDNTNEQCINEQDYTDGTLFVTKYSHKSDNYHQPRIIRASEIPDTTFRKNPSEIKGFLQGVCVTAGVINDGKITIKTDSFKTCTQLQIMFSSIGIKSHCTTANHTESLACESIYTIYIPQEQFTPDAKSPVETCTITSRDIISNEPVYSITVDNKSHTYWTGGLNVSNCGEIPLCPYDSCRLIALNLFSYVVNPFTTEAYFDYSLFADHAQKAARIMDDIIDLEIEKIDAILAKIESDPESEDIKSTEVALWTKIKNKAILGRRAGIGITAEGDALAALGLTYGSNEAIVAATNIHKTLAVCCYKASVNLAKERGSFPMYNSKKEEHNPMIQRIKDEDPNLYDEMLTYGRRNIAMLTIAPTGTTSLMSQTTSGIEPVFMPVYKRRKKVNPNDKDVKATFVDSVGDSWEEYYVFHHNFIKWAEINKNMTESHLKTLTDSEINQLVSESPYHKATANDVDWVSKVKMQGSIQKWIDHSISVTVNLPREASEELVSQVYLTAWESGCKGVTVYREGSRDGVLVSKDDKGKRNNADQERPQSRPTSLDCDVVRFNNGSDKWIAFIGKWNEKPYEIFTGKIEDDALFVPTAVKTGCIIKVKQSNEESRYDFQYQDKYGYINTIGGISRMFDKSFWNYSKLISGTLRNGMPVVDVVNLVSSLNLDGESLNTWNNGVARALKRYIPNGTEAPKGNTCTSCNESTLVYEEGCLVCKCCGYSKCS